MAQLTQQSPKPIPNPPKTLSQLLSWKPPLYNDIIGWGVLPQNQMMVLYGEEETWKSWMALEAVWSVSLGSPNGWLGFPVVQHRVMVLNTEITEAMYQERAKVMSQSRGPLENNAFFVTDLDRKIDTARGINDTITELKSCKAELFILDDLYRAVMGNLAQGPDVNRLIDSLNKIRKEAGVAILIIHHSRQADHDGTGRLVRLGTSEMYGASFLKDHFDTIFSVTKGKEVMPGLESITIEPQKQRLASFKLPTREWLVRRKDMRFLIA